jgi:hypothetical protein
MNPDLNTIAGANADAEFQRQRDACVAALSPVVRELVRAGMPINPIVAALAQVSVHALGRDTAYLN